MKQHFETYLKRCDWPVTATIDYASFKLLLRFFVERRRQCADASYVVMDESLTTTTTAFQQKDSIRTSHPAFRHWEDDDAAVELPQREQTEFWTFLQYEIHKTVHHYQEYRQFLDTGDFPNGDTAKDALIQAALYHATTLITVRQILIRYHAFQERSLGKEPYEYFGCGGFTSNENDNEITKMLHETFQWHEIAQLHYILTQTYGKDAFADDIIMELEQVLHQSELIFQQSLTTKDQVWMSSLRNYVLSGLLQKSHSIGTRHLKLELRAVARLKQRQRNDDTYLHPSNRFPLFLNLLSCFLFMMNNYIIEPSSAYYANALGASDALSGLMIGGAAWFAILSAIVYSYWTNECYKTPIVFAGILMILGNLLYAAADAYGSMTMCLIGRALTGLGAPRVINRRYVADATPFHLRTLASAGFCLATAIGSALGPGVAIVLDAIPEFVMMNANGRAYVWNGMTAPGYFMSTLWCIYTVVIVFTFREPVRSGLIELQQRERQNLEQQQKDMPIALQENMIEKNCDETEDMDDSNSVGSFASRSHFSSVGRNDPVFSCCCPHITRAVALTMSLIFMKRIALESIVGSTSVITKNRYGWSIQNVGTLHLVNGILVIPVSALAGWLSTLYEDRFLATAFLGVTLAGMMVMVDYADLGSFHGFAGESNAGYDSDSAWSVGPIKYIVGSLVAFSGIEACESYVASMMSKVVPSALAVGTFNSGLLATLVGTGGRAAGDLFITLMGLISIRHLLNLLIIPGLLLVALSILLIRSNYRILDV